MRLRGGGHRRVRALVVSLAVMVGFALVSAPAASAHPLGNFTVNYYSGIHVGPTTIDIDVVVDRAEIPTLQAFPDAASGQQPAGADTWRVKECADLAAAARILVADQVQALGVTGSRLQLLPGAAGLATSRLECTLRASSTGASLVGRTVSYQAAPTGGRVGWHEVTAVGDGVALSGSDVPTVSPSKELSAYPADLLTSPLDQRTAAFTVVAGAGEVTRSGPSALLPNTPFRGLDQITTAYTDLVSRADLTPGFAVLAVLLSILLGALHAFAPGHGKTLMAAYLVGRSGTWRQAAVIGVSVTVTHTIGVLLLGVALSAAVLVAPEQAYPWLGLISGVLLTGIGISLLRSARSGHVHGPGGHTHGPSAHTHGPSGDTQGPAGHTHSPSGDTHRPTADNLESSRDAPGRHQHAEVLALTTPQAARHPHGFTVTADPHPADHERGHEHAHEHDHEHEHEHEHATPPTRRLFSNGRLAAVGLVGGMVPSPSALLVLLGGIALGRAWFGAVLVLFYGIGMAAALVGTGLLLVAARDRFERWNALRVGQLALPGQALVLRWSRRLPLLTAIVVILVGLWIAVRSLGTL